MKNRSSQHLVKQGIIASKAGQNEDAARLFRRAIEIDSNNELAWLWLSGVAENTHERRYCLEQALQINPENVQASAGLKWLDQQGAGTSPPMSISPTAADTGMQHLSDHDRRELCPFCGTPVSSQSTFCTHCRCALVTTCPECEAQRPVDEAICDSCGYALGDYREGAAFFADLGDAYLRNGQADLAMGAWKCASELDHGDANAFLRLGQAQLMAGKIENAQVSFRQAVERATAPPTLMAVGRIYEQTEQWEEAQRAYENALAIDERAPGTHFALGRVLIEARVYQAAFPHMRQATRLDPEHAGAWFLLGQLYELAHEPSKAKQAYENAVSLAGKPSRQSGDWIERASKRLELLNPSLPESVALNWPETARQTGALAIIPTIAALVNAGLRPWHIAPADYLGVILAILGAYLWVSAAGLPLNPGMRAMLGQDGLSHPRLRTAVGLLGGAFWATSLLYILLAPALINTLSRG